MEKRKKDECMKKREELFRTAAFPSKSKGQTEG